MPQGGVNNNLQHHAILIASGNVNEMIAQAASGNKGKVLQHLDKLHPMYSNYNQ